RWTVDFQNALHCRNAPLDSLLGCTVDAGHWKSAARTVLWRATAAIDYGAAGSADRLRRAARYAGQGYPRLYRGPQAGLNRPPVTRMWPVARPQGQFCLLGFCCAVAVIFPGHHSTPVDISLPIPKEPVM